jgi:hypothetical protein
MCCTDGDGCGVVQADWMVNVNATYQGTGTINGYAVNTWLAMGLQQNFYSATVGSNIPVELAQEPNDIQYFLPPTWVVGAQPASTFALPSYCSANCSASAPLSLCGLLNPAQ